MNTELNSGYTGFLSGRLFGNEIFCKVHRLEALAPPIVVVRPSDRFFLQQLDVDPLVKFHVLLVVEFCAAHLA